MFLQCLYAHLHSHGVRSGLHVNLAPIGSLRLVSTSGGLPLALGTNPTCLCPFPRQFGSRPVLRQTPRALALHLSLQVTGITLFIARRGLGRQRVHCAVLLEGFRGYRASPSGSCKNRHHPETRTSGTAARNTTTSWMAATVGYQRLPQRLPGGLGRTPTGPTCEQHTGY